MPHKEIEADDPMELVGVVLPATAETMREMAYVFAEEFARMGHDRQQILGLFKNPFYAGAYGVYQALGEESIQAIVDECINVWGKVQFSSISSVSSSGLSRGDGRNDQTDQTDKIDCNWEERTDA